MSDGRMLLKACVGVYQIAVVVGYPVEFQLKNSRRTVMRKLQEIENFLNSKGLVPELCNVDVLVSDNKYQAEDTMRAWVVTVKNSDEVAHMKQLLKEGGFIYLTNAIPNEKK